MAKNKPAKATKNISTERMKAAQKVSPQARVKQSAKFKPGEK